MAKNTFVAEVNFNPMILIVNTNRINTEKLYFVTEKKNMDAEENILLAIYINLINNVINYLPTSRSALSFL